MVQTREYVSPSEVGDLLLAISNSVTFLVESRKLPEWAAHDALSSVKVIPHPGQELTLPPAHKRSDRFGKVHGLLIGCGRQLLDHVTASAQSKEASEGQRVIAATAQRVREAGRQYTLALRGFIESHSDEIELALELQIESLKADKERRRRTQSKGAQITLTPSEIRRLKDYAIVDVLEQKIKEIESVGSRMPGKGRKIIDTHSVVRAMENLEGLVLPYCDGMIQKKLGRNSQIDYRMNALNMVDGSNASAYTLGVLIGMVAFGTTEARYTAVTRTRELINSTFLNEAEGTEQLTLIISELTEKYGMPPFGIRTERVGRALAPDLDSMQVAWLAMQILGTGDNETQVRRMGRVERNMGLLRDIGAIDGEYGAIRLQTGQHIGVIMAVLAADGLEGEAREWIMAVAENIACAPNRQALQATLQSDECQIALGHLLELANQSSQAYQEGVEALKTAIAEPQVIGYIEQHPSERLRSGTSRTTERTEPLSIQGVSAVSVSVPVCPMHRTTMFTQTP